VLGGGQAARLVPWPPLVSGFATISQPPRCGVVLTESAPSEIRPCCEPWRPIAIPVGVLPATRLQLASPHWDCSPTTRRRRASLEAWSIWRAPLDLGWRCHLSQPRPCAAHKPGSEFAGAEAWPARASARGVPGHTPSPAVSLRSPAIAFTFTAYEASEPDDAGLGLALLPGQPLRLAPPAAARRDPDGVPRTARRPLAGPVRQPC